MNQPSHILYSTLDNLPAIAKTLLQHAGDQRIWLFEGEMGAGKTTLIKALCTQLDVQDTVVSPTFSLIHEYITASGETIYHFDLYRLRHEAEAQDLDCETYFESGRYCFVEWPSKALGLIPSAYYQITLAIQTESQRLLHMRLYKT
mmetsp:Transcript_3878/g.8739  ORF Transcript_3878/g.8739 Transcript_3878/m.8739 type:complete len:146 (-) Transcript_3878:907-1344(-)